MDAKPGSGIHRILSFLTPCVFLVGCSEQAPAPTSADPVSLQSKFDPQTAGTISGRVTWSGDAPVDVQDKVFLTRLGRDLPQHRRHWLNPNLPRVDARSHGVGNAVVFLRHVDPAQSRPWDYPPVTVVMADFKMTVEQGERPSNYGFVRLGDSVRMISRQPVAHALRAEGAAFFSLPFPDPDRPLSRPMVRKGIVELSSAAGYFWMRSYLFVDDHPYYTRTGPDGSYVLPQVPPGNYELVCWMPDWKVKETHLDPEIGIITRVLFGPPLEQAQRVEVKPGKTTEAIYDLSAAQLDR